MYIFCYFIVIYMFYCYVYNFEHWIGRLLPHFSISLFCKSILFLQKILSSTINYGHDIFSKYTFSNFENNIIDYSLKHQNLFSIVLRYVYLL